jgi:hypothetical protein
MPSPQPLFVIDYATAPQMSVSSAVTLCIGMLTVVPKAAPQAVRFAAKRMRTSVVELQRAWGLEFDAGSADTTPRKADTRVDRAVRATSMCLEAHALLSPEHVPQATRAEAAYQRLFAQGLRFINLPYPEQWSHVQRLVKAIDGDPVLTSDVDEFVGETIVGELRASHEAYGEALGITVELTEPEAALLQERLETVRAAVVGYALQIVAMQDVDAERIPAARRALEPIDQLRARQARQARRSASARDSEPTGEAGVEPAGEEQDSVTPTTPVPEVEDDEAPST